jgi:hypothetical protein
MPIDPDDPPIWLRKLHVSAAQLSPSDYPATPAEGILQVCRLSDEALALSKTSSNSFDSGSATSTRSSEDLILLKLTAGLPRDFDDVMTIVANPTVHLDLDYLWSWAERLGLQSELHYVLISTKQE